MIYNIKEAPIRVFGIPYFEEKHVYERLPEALRNELPSAMTFLGRRTPGARAAFRTDSEHITVRMTLETLSVDIGMALFACQAVNVMIGERGKERFAGIAVPPDYNTKTCEKTFTKSPDEKEVTLYLPRNEVISDVEIELDDGATIEAPTPYKNGTMLLYGSSITEGGCPANGTNVYPAILSRNLDMDYYNFGFSGSAKGELPMADYINQVMTDHKVDLFVYDYDHNAPSADHLRKTHEPFFKRIREKHPTLPVIIMTRPDFDYDPASAERREVIRQTYENAVAAGDKFVRFIDGETFFGKEERHLCTIDTCHPNDLGFVRMAHVIEPVVKELMGL